MEKKKPSRSSAEPMLGEQRAFMDLLLQVLLIGVIPHQLLLPACRSQTCFSPNAKKKTNPNLLKMIKLSWIVLHKAGSRLQTQLRSYSWCKLVMAMS